MATTTPGTTTTNRFQPGDPVQVVARESTPQDVKSQLYYTHYANLYGTILKLYGEEASVLVDRESLPAEIRVRHEEGEKAARQKWLDGLSEEARNRLSGREKEFGYNYAVLVSVGDLKPFDPATAPKPEPSKSIPASVRQEAKQVARAAAAVDPITGQSSIASPTQIPDDDGEYGTDSAAKRVSENELSAAEEAYLRDRAARAAKKNGASS